MPGNRVVLCPTVCVMLALWSAGLNGAESAAEPQWRPLWSREPGAGSASADDGAVGGRPPVVRVEHKGSRDWALTRTSRLAVRPGDICDLGCRLRVQGEGGVSLCVTTYDAAGKPVEWVFGETAARASPDWQPLRSRFIVPEGVAALEPRVVGNGPVTVWVDSFAITTEGNVADARPKDVPYEVSIENQLLRVTLTTADGVLAVLDKRSGRTWRQRVRRPDLVVTRAKADGRTIDVGWVHPAGALQGKAAIALDPAAPEVLVTLEADGPLPRPLAYPHSFVVESPAYLVVPMNEGISYPVDDASISPMRLVAYGGHGICMAFFGVTDGRSGQMAIIETPDDAAIRIVRLGGLLAIAPEWDAEKGRFGYSRRIRYVFFQDGGHVAMAKRYRAYAKQVGLLKTLQQKRQDVPAVDLLVGAVNVWCWDKDAPAIIRQMQAAGIDRILWSNAQSPENLKVMNDMPGVLTSRYDIYQDVMNPENFSLLAGVHADWTTAAWPKDLMIDSRGQWVRGWQVRAKDGSMIPCGVLCDRQAPAYAEKRIAEELKTRPYRCRFIDTTTASPWRECYSPEHPQTRRESRKFKMDLLAVVSDKFKLVTGSETGHDAAVPYLHYFEGMLSLGPYRVPDAGRDMQKIWNEVPEAVAKFQLGHQYRLPLWELVYHDCVVAQWYWGDYNNKLPALWDKRDLFNALYGTPPMFMFNRAGWQAQQDRFVRSYKATAPVARATGYCEMTDHRFLTSDRSVQQTVFAGGVTVTVNFGPAPFRMPDGSELAPMSSRVTGMRQ